MIKYDRPPEPEFFSDAKTEAQLGFDGALGAHGSYSQIPDDEKRAIFALCSEKRTKDVLFGASHEKCAYCELKPAQSGTRESDHFFPKSLYHSQAFEWINLLPCCHSCNSHKGSWDPGVDVLLDPSATDPRPHVCYPQLRMEPVETSPFDQAIRNVRDACGLDRYELVKLRARILTDFTKFEIALDDALESLNAAATPQQKARRISKLRSALATIEGLADPDEILSGFCSFKIETSQAVARARARLLT
jgi:uncharacterized protein (TIGR02646 family)